jgi:hypothetical protein
LDILFENAHREKKKNIPTSSPSLSCASFVPMKKANSVPKKRKSGVAFVTFHEVVTVRELPSEEAEDAIITRKGLWEAAPDHDELWDGHNRDFW